MTDDDESRGFVRALFARTVSEPPERDPADDDARHELRMLTWRLFRDEGEQP